MRPLLLACLAVIVVARDSLQDLADQLPTEGEEGGNAHAEPPIPQAGELAATYRARGGNPGPIPDHAIYVGWAIPTVHVDPILDEVYGTFLARGGERVTGPEGAPVSPYAVWNGANWVLLPIAEA